MIFRKYPSLTFTGIEKNLEGDHSKQSIFLLVINNDKQRWIPPCPPRDEKLEWKCESKKSFRIVFDNYPNEWNVKLKDNTRSPAAMVTRLNHQTLPIVDVKNIIDAVSFYFKVHDQFLHSPREFITLQLHFKVI